MKVLLRRLQPVAQDDGRGDILAELAVRQRERHRLQHRGMIHQRFIDLARRDLFAAAIDDLLQPSGDREIAVGVDGALIAGAEPAVDESFAVGLRVALITAVTFSPRMTTSPTSPVASTFPSSSMIATSGPAARPTEPGLLTPPSGLDAIWCAASVMP